MIQRNDASALQAEIDAGRLSGLEFEAFACALDIGSTSIALSLAEQSKPPLSIDWALKAVKADDGSGSTAEIVRALAPRVLRSSITSDLLNASSSHGNVAIIEAILDDPAYTTPSVLESALHCAASASRTEAFALLLSKMSDAKRRSLSATTLKAAAGAGNIEIIEMLLPYSSSEKIIDAVPSAALSGSPKVFQRMLAAAEPWPNLFARHTALSLSLRNAAARGYTHLFSLILPVIAETKDPTARHTSIRNAIHFSAMAGRNEAVKALLPHTEKSAWASKLIADLTAAAIDRPETVRLLLPMLDPAVDQGRAARNAAASGKTESLALLASVTPAQDFIGNALQAAAVNGHLAALELLLGMDPPVKDIVPALFGAHANNQFDTLERLSRASGEALGFVLENTPHDNFHPKAYALLMAQHEKNIFSQTQEATARPASESDQFTRTPQHKI